MFDFQKKKKIKRILYSPVILLLLLIVFAFGLKALWGVYQKESLSATNLQRQKDELATLTNRQTNLVQSVNYLKTDEGIEAEIRSKFREVKEGESVAVILDNETASSTAPKATSTPSFWHSILGWIGL